MSRPFTLAAATAGAVVVAAVVWAAAVDRSAAANPATTTPSTAASASAAIDTLSAANGINLRRTVTVQVVQQTKGAVVNISAKKLVSEPVRYRDFFQSFDTGQVVQVPANSLGTGFIVHRDGYVVTNNHVIDRARQISVELDDGRTLPADVVGADLDADLAVLKIKSPAPLPTLAMGDSSDLMIGEPVIAVGNPLGLSHSVSTGIVSALHRDINPERPEPPTGLTVRGEEAALRDLVQTDAAINRGNSGGPLLNAYGQVIGINTAVRGDAQNIGFAIPIDRLRNLIPELMNPSQVNKVDVPLKLAERRTPSEPATVTTRLVTVGEKSVGVVEVNGRRPANIVDAYAALLALPPNTPFTVGYADGTHAQLTTTATPLPDTVVQAKKRFGMAIVPVTPMLANRYHLPQEDGLLLTAVDRGGVAAAAGLQPGDVVDKFAGVPLNTLDDFGALLGRLRPSGRAAVHVVRGAQSGYLLMRF